ncbi:conserved hypothetical protein [Acidianus hospitalis W1]|uniref:Uncharacterized protein n=1 Tax=Acidianus hospitalis (strain W1) TaxID=933801 RepID=F4B7R9_ACIHW|nr:hypothetical protein [Acidianus hospitalis]AEE94816.1 conserved hypothetical protein [Acidianus hospitalis W1]
MLSEELVISALKELYDGRPVAFSKIKRKLKADGEELSLVLEKLEKEGKIKKIESGSGKSFELTSSNNGDNKFDLLLKEITEIKDEIKKLQEAVLEKKKLSENYFDEIYNEVKDNLGYAHLKDIRIEMGLTKEEFYSKLKRHIEENYELIAGGEEGFVKKGSVYGIIIKRKR